MLKRQREKQQQMNLVIMEQMVPEDHFLRKVDRAVDFSFIYDLCAPLYCADNGRPAIDPEILFRMLLVDNFLGAEAAEKLPIKLAREDREIERRRIGPVLGAHLGRGCVGVAYIAEE